MPFFHDHPISGIGMILGPAIYIGGLALHLVAIDEMHPPLDVWQIVGAIVFASSLIGIVIKQHHLYKTHSGNINGGRYSRPSLPALPHVLDFRNTIDVQQYINTYSQNDELNIGDAIDLISYKHIITQRRWRYEDTFKKIRQAAFEGK